MKELRISQTVFITVLGLLLTNFAASSKAETQLYVGQSETIVAPTPPAGTALYAAEWGCSHDNVSLKKNKYDYSVEVTVDSYFTGYAKVRCDYYYKWYVGKYMYTANSTVYYDVTCKPVKLSISPKSMNLNIGEGQSISYSYSPGNVSPKPRIRFLSNDSRVATVNDAGYVRAVGPGYATITVENSAGPDETCSVNVKAPNPTGISLQDNLTIVVGESETVPYTVYPSGAKYSLTWISSDTKTATVNSSGRVTGIKDGTAYITAQIDGYNFTDYCTVTVEKPTLKLYADPAGGMFENSVKVSLTASDNKADIYYTVDGKTPNRSSTKYTGPIAITNSLTLMAIAYHDDYKESDIISAKYEVSSLKVVSMNPNKDDDDCGKSTIPFIQFNSEIKAAENYEDIKLFKSGTREIPGEKIICNDKLYFVSDEELEAGLYKLYIPKKSIQSPLLGANFDIELSFCINGSITESFAKITSSRILKTNGDLYGWGYSDDYNFPDPNMKDSFTPVLLFHNVSDFVSSYPNKWILKNDGTLIGWGGNYNSGETVLESSCYILGDGTRISRSTPVTILTNVRTICEASWHQGAIKSDNTLWLWGRNACGQIGNGKKEDAGQLSPVQVLDNVKDASLGTRHTVALKYDGSVWVWGAGSKIGESSTRTTPLKKMTDVAEISSNNTDHVLVLKKDGTAWTFGENSYGQIGDGTITDRTSPVKVLSDVKFIEAIGWQNIAIKEDGSLWRWGFWSNGISTNKDYYWLKPKKILDDVVVAHANSSQCYAIRKDGTLWGMGVNPLGDGTDNNSTSMIKIMDDVVDFSMRGLALKKDGSLWAWGYGPLGDGTAKKSNMPVKILDGAQKTELEDVRIETDANLAKDLPVGAKLIFIPVLYPANGEYNSITWEIKDKSIASISQRGVVTAKSPGNTTVLLEVTSDNKKFNLEYNLTVEEKSIVPTSVSIAKSETVYVGESIELITTFTPSNAHTTLTWHSTDPSVATVSGGKVYGKSEGQATIYCVTANGITSNDCNVSVNYRTPTSIVCTPSELSLPIGESRQLNYFVTPSDARYALEWFSSDETVATVSSSGLVVAVSAGQATIKVCTDNGKVATCEVNVQEQQFYDLVVWLKNGEKNLFRLSEYPIVTYADGAFILKTSRTEAEYKAASVRKFTLIDEKDDPAASAQEVKEKPDSHVYYSDDVVEMTGGNPNSRVNVYRLDGKRVDTMQTDAGGNLTFSVAQYPAGTYIIESETITFKISKR